MTKRNGYDIIKVKVKEGGGRRDGRIQDKGDTEGFRVYSIDL